MAHRVVWKIAAPMIGLGVVLLVLGAFAAYNVHEQQRTSSEIVAHQAHAMLALHELNIVMREIRYQIVEFLRTGNPRHLNDVAALHDSADALLERTKQLARPGREQHRTQVVEAGYRTFFREYHTLLSELAARAPLAPDGSLSGHLVATPAEVAALTRASDELLTKRVLKPLEEGIADNRRFVEETNQASQVTAQHLKIGFLLLGICGAVAGLLLGTVIARTIGRSIVQLNVTVRSVAGRLSDVTGPVTFSHTGDLTGINSGLQGLERDIADLIQRLQRRETELLRSEQLAKVGQLAAGLAHELRNPLMPMKILVQAALERKDGSGLKGRSLEVINEEISRLEESIRSFLDYARPPVPLKLPLDIREVVSGTVELVMGRARLQHVAIEMTLPDDPLPVLVDRGQIRQLLLNLLLNALDALPDGGQIECTVEACPDAKSSSSAGAAEETEEPVLISNSFNEHDALRLLGRPVHRPVKTTRPNWLAIHVTDNGPGIPAAAMAGVFEPFMTTKETGTGLGLSVSRRIALAHDGELTVRNHPAGGAEFTLLLPGCV
jgi:signal transduction histidine kinase